MFTEPYSPDLNPIEYMFGKYKAILKRFSHDSEDSVSCNVNALLSITNRDAGDYFRHCGVPGCESFPRNNYDGELEE